MAFRYMKDGAERVAADVEELERALRAGDIEPATPVFDDTVNARLRASAVIAVHKRGPREPIRAQAPSAAAAPPAPRASAKAQPKAAREQAPSRPGRVRMHGMAAFIAAIASAIVAGELFDATPYWLGQQAGRGAFVVLVVWGLAGWILGKKTDTERIRLSWIASVAFMLIMIVPTYFAAKWSEERRAADRAAVHRVAELGRRSAAQLEASIRESDGGAAPTTPASPASQSSPAPASGPQAGPETMLTKAAALIEAMQAEAEKEGNAWQAFEASVATGGALTPATLVSEEERQRHRQAFSSYLAESAVHAQRVKGIFVRYRAKFVQSLGDGSDARSFLDGFDSSVRKSNALLDESARLEKEFAAEVSAMYDFMASRGDAVGVQKGQVVFATDADVRAFNERLARILALAKHLEAIDQQRLADAKAGVTRLEKIESSR